LYNIALVHGVSTSEVYRSAWWVVHAVNKSKKLKIKFPVDHKEQQRCVAKGFLEKSTDAKFGVCAGANDSILIWTKKAAPHDCETTNCGSKKFFCGRKKKFGLNLQAVCDVNGMFLDISICHPGATSDYLAFTTSSFKHLLENLGFLSPGLVPHEHKINGDGSIQRGIWWIKSGLQLLPLLNPHQDRVCIWYAHTPVRVFLQASHHLLGWAKLLHLS
jgi:hypothetical protein